MKFALTDMTKEEILDIIQDCQAELDSRRKEEKIKLIRDFENAFFALKNAEITIRYTDYEQEADRILIDNITHFEFDLD